MTPRVLVLTLHSGENELEACKASVQSQEGVAVEQVVISGLGNREAHAALYKTIMARRNAFDLFIKIDADMVVNRPTAVAEVAGFFAKRPAMDHMVAKVLDHFTGTYIYGVNAFSNRVSWTLPDHDALFVDPAPEFAGESTDAPEGITPFIDHAPDPHPFQSFHFGYHRGLKAYQPGRAFKRYKAMPTHLATIRDVYRQYRATGRADLGLAYLASQLVFAGELAGETGDKNDPAVMAAFEHLAGLSRDEIDAEIAALRSRHALRYAWWQYGVGPALMAGRWMYGRVR